MAVELVSVWWALVLLGIAAGILSGTLGVGSGIIVVPALVMLLSFSQKSAQGTALAVMVPMALLGAVRYWRNPAIPMDLGVTVLIVCGALAGTFIGTELASRLPGPVLRRIFAVFVLVVGLRMLLLSGPPHGTSAPAPAAPHAAHTEETSRPEASSPPHAKGPHK